MGEGGDVGGSTEITAGCMYVYTCTCILKCRLYMYVEYGTGKCRLYMYVEYGTGKCRQRSYIGWQLSLTTIDRYLYACGSITQYYLPTQWLFFWAEVRLKSSRGWRWQCGRFYMYMYIESV